MGLDVSLHIPDWGFRAGSYSGFNNWRTMLAQIVDINLQEMDGFKDWGKTKGIEWTGEEPFYWLLNHSDCDGEIWEVDELYEDFVKYRNRAYDIWKNYPRFLEKYDQWMELCRDAVEKEGYIHFG